MRREQKTISAEDFAEAYETGHYKTINLLKSRGFTEQMAEEAAQAAWARGWERRSQLRDPSKSVPWVNSIALNLGRTICRRAARLDELQEIAVPSCDHVIASVDVRRKLAQCPLRERTLLEKRYMQQWDLNELAAEEGCSACAVRIRLYRARQRLRQLFETGQLLETGKKKDRGNGSHGDSREGTCQPDCAPAA